MGNRKELLQLIQSSADAAIEEAAAKGRPIIPMNCSDDVSKFAALAHEARSPKAVTPSAASTPSVDSRNTVQQEAATAAMAALSGGKQVGRQKSFSRGRSKKAVQEDLELHAGVSVVTPVKLKFMAKSWLRSSKQGKTTASPNLIT